MAYIDPITGAYVADSLDALPPGYNQPKAGNEANVARMRAALNNGWDDNTPLPNLERPATDPFSLIKHAYQNMPGAAVGQAGVSALSDILGGTVGNLYGVGKQIYEGNLGDPKAGNRAFADAQRLAQQFHIEPQTQSGRDFYNTLNKIGEATGPLPELFALPQGRRFTPDDLRVAGKMATEDFRNFGSDYANAKAGVQREYPTMGSRAAQFTDVAADLSRPLAEKAYDMYMNPRDAESFGINPISNLSGLAPAGGPMYAVKPKGGNWPTNLGSTAPLKEQGSLGEHLSKIQINDPVAAFENQLEKHHPSYSDTHRLQTAWKEFLQTYLADNDFDVTKSVEDLKKEAAQNFTNEFNIKAVGENPDAKLLYSPSQIEAIAPAYNSWVMGPYQKYLTNQYATGLETDPLLQVIEKSNMPVEALRPNISEPSEYAIQNVEDRRKSYAQRYASSGLDLENPQYANIGKQTATTPIGQRVEMEMDRSLYPNVYQISNFDDTDKYPQGARLHKQAVINDLITDVPKETMLPAVRKKVLNDLISGKMSPDKLANALPANVAQQIIKDYQAEQQSKANVQKAKDTWRQSRYDAIESAVPFDDGSKIQVITKEDARTNENLVLRDLGQSTIDLNQCIGAGCHNTLDYPGVHGPFIEPHTGKSPKGAYKYEDTHVQRYVERLKKGETEIARLIDPNGVAQASVELRVRDPRDVKGDAVAHREFIKDWLQQHDNNTYTIVMDQGFTGSGNTKTALFQKHPDLEKAFDAYFRPVAEKQIQEMKGKNNGKIAAEYMPQMVDWLNSMGDQLTDVRDFDKLPDVVDLNKTYDSISKIADSHPHWDVNTVEDFLDKVTDEKLLPRFFTADDFALKATEFGVDLSDRPKKKGTNATQEVYEKLSQQLRLTYEDPYLQEYVNGDPNVRDVVNTDIYSNPQQYGVGDYSVMTILDAVQRLRDEGLHDPNARSPEFDEAYQAAIAEIPNQWNAAFVNQINGNNTRIRQNLRDHMRENLNFYNLRNYPENVRNAVIDQIAQQGVPEFGNPPIERLSIDDRDVLEMGMDHYFDNPNDPDFQVPAGRPMQLIRILAGNQNNGHAELPRIAHQQLVNYLLNQDDHIADIGDLRDRLQIGEHFLNGAQADNMLRIIEAWLQEFPLPGEEGIRNE